MNYRIKGHNNVCVVTLNGDIGRDDRDGLLACAEEIKKEDFQSAILLFQNVTSIEIGTYRELTMLLHEIRQKGSLKEDLGRRGVIRLNELKDLKEILPK